MFGSWYGCYVAATDATCFATTTTGGPDFIALDMARSVTEVSKSGGDCLNMEPTCRLCSPSGLCSHRTAVGGEEPCRKKDV